MQSPRQAVMQTLTTVEGLPHLDCWRIAQLDLSIYESLVVGYLRRAVILLEETRDLPHGERVNIWRRWQKGTLNALRGALRYRRRIELILTITVTGAVLPAPDMVFYTAYEHIVRLAMREPRIEHPSRKRRPFRLEEAMLRVPLWIKLPDRLVPGLNLSDDACADLRERGFRQVWGVEVYHHTADAVLHRLQAITQVMWMRENNVTYIAPLGDHA